MAVGFDTKNNYFFQPLTSNDTMILPLDKYKIEDLSNAKFYLGKKRHTFWQNYVSTSDF